MAVEISNGTTVPHAANYADLLTKLITFASANGWVVVENTADKVILKGTGSGSDEIFVGFKLYADAANNAYGMFVNGYTGYVPSTAFQSLPGSMSVAGYLAMPGLNSEMPYWFVVNSRRIIVVVTNSITYRMLYAGWFLPFYTPNQYPYPICVGGSYKPNNLFDFGVYLDNSIKSTMPWDSNINTSLPMFFKQPSGLWKQMVRQGNMEGLFPFNVTHIGTYRNGVDGNPILTPTAIEYRNSSLDKGIMGELDGIYHIPGFGQLAGSITTIGGVDYLTVPNVARLGTSDFAAIKLA